MNPKHTLFIIGIIAALVGALLPVNPALAATPRDYTDVVVQQPECKDLSYAGNLYDAETTKALDYFNSFVLSVYPYQCETTFTDPPAGVIIQINGQKLLETTPGHVFQSDKTLAEFGLKDNQKIIFTYVYVTDQNELISGARFLYTMWLLVKDDGTACFIRGPYHPTVALQNAVCFPDKYNNSWVADRTLCKAPYYSNGVWACYEEYYKWRAGK